MPHQHVKGFPVAAYSKYADGIRNKKSPSTETAIGSTLSPIPRKMEATFCCAAIPIQNGAIIESIVIAVAIAL